jgi:hypothetical protein
MLLGGAPLAVRAQVWYMHDGAPAHLSRAVLDVLNNIFHDRWIGRGGPTMCPPRLPDLNPLEFYPWVQLRTPVYAAPVDSGKTLHHQTVNGCQNICKYPGIFEWMRWSMMGRVEARTESHGGHFEYLL